MLEMVEDAQAEDDIEPPQARLGQLVEVQNPVADARFQPLLQLQKIGDFHAIDRRHLGAVRLGLEAEPPIPGPDVQHALPRQVRGNGKPLVPLPQPVELVEALDVGSVRQFETVIPALLGKFLAEVHAPAGFMHKPDYLRRVWIMKNAADYTGSYPDRKSTRLNSQSLRHLVCRLL